MKEILAKMNLPKVLEDGFVKSDWDKRRRELVDILANEEFGIMPSAPEKIDVEVKLDNKEGLGGGTVHKEVNISFDTEKGKFTFPITYFAPNDGKKHPVFVYIAFTPARAFKPLPLEEMVEKGFGLAFLDYQDIALDKDDENENGIAKMYARRNDGTDWGKIGMWAFAASRVADFLEKEESCDMEKLAVIGHSRLGKTALWAGANDERFKFVISNDSGCSGAAISRDKEGESIERITTVFPYWFCENYKKYAGKEDDCPFDQHFLTSAIAPRYLYVASASQDSWACPRNELLGAMAAGEIYEALGMTGLVFEDAQPKADHSYNEGSVAYHVRTGNHFLARQDWLKYMDFIASK